MDIKVDALGIVGGNSNFHCYVQLSLKLHCVDDWSKQTVERKARVSGVPPEMWGCSRGAGLWEGAVGQSHPLEGRTVHPSPHGLRVSVPCYREKSLVLLGQPLSISQSIVLASLEEVTLMFRHV